MVKQRLVVMNGQCIVQALGPDNKWHDEKVEKAASRPPGIYNLHAAVAADPVTPSDGVIVYLNGKSVYQQVGKSIVKHALQVFQTAPLIGVAVTISYLGGKATIAPSQAKARARKI
jgi:hypothetical protein